MGRYAGRRGGGRGREPWAGEVVGWGVGNLGPGRLLLGDVLILSPLTQPQPSIQPQLIHLNLPLQLNHQLQYFNVSIFHFFLFLQFSIFQYFNSFNFFNFQFFNFPYYRTFQYFNCLILN